jgi:hypothetical protein
MTVQILDIIQFLFLQSFPATRDASDNAAARLMKSGLTNAS